MSLSGGLGSSFPGKEWSAQERTELEMAGQWLQGQQLALNAELQNVARKLSVSNPPVKEPAADFVKVGKRAIEL